MNIEFKLAFYISFGFNVVIISGVYTRSYLDTCHVLLGYAIFNEMFLFVCVEVLRLSQQLRSCRAGQLPINTVPGQAYLKFAKLQYVSSGFRCQLITGSLMRLY